MVRSPAVLDACALVPIALTDTLLRVAEKGLYRPLWSYRILTEVRVAVAHVHPGLDISRRIDTIQAAFPDALVIGWEKLEQEISLPDENDRHVVAAAVRGGAQCIVTHNVRDFPADSLKRFGLEAVRPDEFLVDLFDHNPSTLRQVIREQAAHARRPPLTPPDLAIKLGRGGAPKFAARILRYLPETL